MMHKNLKIWRTTAFRDLALAGLLMTTLVACGDRNDTAATAGKTPEAISAEVATLAAELVPEAGTATGSIEPWSRTSLATKIMGRIESIAVREGDRVRKDQVLVQLEQRDLAAAVATARAGVTMAEARLENAEVHFNRITDLHSRSSVTDKNLEDAKAGYRVAKAALAQARAAQSQAEVMLSYAVIKAPRSGQVVAKRAEAGDLASPGQPILILEQTHRVRVVLRVSESEIVGLKAGDPAQASIDVLDRSVPATVDRIVPAGDPASRTYEVQLVLDNPDRSILSGMFVRASVGSRSRDAFLVPRAAIVRRGELTGIFRLSEDDTARLGWVKLGPEIGDGVEIISGASAGDRFLVAPPAGLVDGTPVQVR